MTYCFAMRLDEGLFMSDTRTNAGIDNISSYRKLHVLRPAPDRVFVLQSAGNLATTQEVLDRIQQDLETPGDHASLAKPGGIASNANPRHRNRTDAMASVLACLARFVRGHDVPLVAVRHETCSAAMNSR